MLAPAIVIATGTIRTKFGLVRLPCPLFIVLVVLVFTESLGDRSRNLTSGSVGKVYTRYFSIASVNSYDSLSPSKSG